MKGHMKIRKKLNRILRRIRRNRKAFALRAGAVLLVLWVLLTLMRCGRKMDREYTGQDTTEESYGVFLGVDATTFSMDLFEGYDMVVVDAQELRSDQLAQLHATGHTVYSYLNVGSIEESRSYFDDYSDCCLDRYENWPEEFWVDVTRPEWQKLVTEELTDRILDADPQIDGLFLDNLDIYAHVRDSKRIRIDPEQVFEALCSILESYQGQDLPVLINGADVFVTELLDQGREDLILGVNQETVFSSILDYDRDRFGKQSREEREYFTDYLDRCSRAGLEVFLLEYTTDPDVEVEILEYCAEEGFRCYISGHVGLIPDE